jgi:O-antigen/teichoic acid export membrane protein
MLRHSFHYFLSKIVPGALGLLSVTVFVRMVGYSEYGRYALLFATAMAFSSGLSGWLSQGILRFQSKYAEASELQEFCHTVATGTVVSAVTGAVFLGVFLWFSGTRSGVGIIVSVAFSAAVLAYTVLLAWLQAALQSRHVMALESIRSVAAFLFPLFLISFVRRNHLFLLFGILLGYLAPLVIYLFRWRATVPAVERPQRHQMPLKKEKSLLNEVWQYGWPVGLFLLLQQGLVISDRHFIQEFAGYSAAGIYASMYDVIVRSFSLIFMPITLAVHPLAMSHWNKGSEAHSFKIIRSAVRWQFYLFVPVAGVLFLFSSLLTRIVIGQPNPQAGSIVLALAFGGFLWQVALLVHKPLEILCQTQRMLIGMITALLVNICGNYWFVPRFGFLASAYVMIASGLAYLILVVIMTPVRVRAHVADLESTKATFRQLSQTTSADPWSTPDA